MVGANRSCVGTTLELDEVFARNILGSVFPGIGWGGKDRSRDGKDGKKRQHRDCFFHFLTGTERGKHNARTVSFIGLSYSCIVVRSNLGVARLSFGLALSLRKVVVRYDA